MLTESYFELVVRDKRGRVLGRRQQRLDSLVIAFIDLLYVHQRNTTGTLTDINGVSRTTSDQAESFRVKGGANDDTLGPVVGTGSAAVAMTDYALGAQIAHGSGAGQLDHKATTFVAPATVGSSRSYEIRRIFENLSGGSITINEVGLYIYNDGTTNTFLMARDLVSGGQAVPDNASATLVYTVQITV